MKISTKGRYAVRAMYEIATNQNEYSSISEISEKQGITIKYLEQIISKLVKANLLETKRGTSGGYKLKLSADKISVLDILSATDDAPEIVPCLKNKETCPRFNSCPSINCWETLNKLIYDYLKSITLKDLINKQNLTI